MKKSLTSQAFLHALGQLAYISCVAWIMQNGENLFGKADKTLFAPIILLLLFVISALISGLLVLGKPILLFMAGSRKEAMHMLLFTLGFLVCFFLIGVIILI